MLTHDAVARAARAAGVDGPVHVHDVLGSTNTEALRLAEQGAPAWTVVAAGHQDGGRGRLGRTWIERPGTSVLLSIVLRPEVQPTDAPLLALAAGASLAAACRTAGGVEARCKWPNDVVVGDRKLAGVLVEAKVSAGRLEHAVVGTGLNVLQDLEVFPPELRTMATSLAIEGGRLDASTLVTHYLRALRELLGSAEFPHSVLAAYRPACATVGRTVRATTTSGREVVGRAVGIGDRGELLVQTQGGEERVAFGEVGHVRANDPTVARPSRPG